VCFSACAQALTNHLGDDDTASGVDGGPHAVHVTGPDGINGPLKVLVGSRPRPAPWRTSGRGPQYWRVGRCRRLPRIRPSAPGTPGSRSCIRTVLSATPSATSSPVSCRSPTMIPSSASSQVSQCRRAQSVSATSAPDRRSVSIVHLSPERCGTVWQRPKRDRPAPSAALSSGRRAGSGAQTPRPRGRR